MMQAFLEWHRSFCMHCFDKVVVSMLHHSITPLSPQRHHRYHQPLDRGLTDDTRDSPENLPPT
jgi:hypothetical protein